MKKLILLSVLIGFAGVCANHVCAGEYYKEFEIKQGMHEDVVNEKYGQPVLTEKIKEGFLPIPKKKALYKIDDSTYIILHFFSGRISEITILEDVNFDEASSLFREN
ncbi:MAG: hypothetical protein ISS46_00460 [Candidatus Omnitrophica bacterium]|nr:hypothetical protein [Candidatus Omnitrophota bacterium]